MVWECDEGQTDTRTRVTNIHRVSKNVPPLTCYNLDIHCSITIICGTSVTDKVRNQNVLCFPTSPNLCFCTTWGNRKPEECIFSLKCCMLFAKNTRNTLKYRLVTAKPPITAKTFDWMHQTGPGILLSVTQKPYVNQVCHRVSRCVNDWRCSSSSRSERQWTVLMGYLGTATSTNVDPIKHITDDSFYSARNARIASAVLATAFPSVRLSVRLSVTRRYCVKTTARSKVQFSPLDSKMCLIL